MVEVAAKRFALPSPRMWGKSRAICGGWAMRNLPAISGDAVTPPQQDSTRIGVRKIEAILSPHNQNVEVCINILSLVKDRGTMRRS